MLTGIIKLVRKYLLLVTSLQIRFRMLTSANAGSDADGGSEVLKSTLKVIISLLSKFHDILPSFANC